MFSDHSTKTVWRIRSQYENREIRSTRDEATEPYPVGAFDVHSPSFQHPMSRRVDAVMGVLKHELTLGGIAGVLPEIYLSIGELFGKGKLKDKLTQVIEDSLKDWDLLSACDSFTAKKSQ